MALSVYAFQNGRSVEQEPDAAVERLLSRGPEMFIAPDDELQECTAALVRRVEGAMAKGLP